MGRDGIQVIIDLADCTHLRGLESPLSAYLQGLLTFAGPAGAPGFAPEVPAW